MAMVMSILRWQWLCSFQYGNGYVLFSMARVMFFWYGNGQVLISIAIVMSFFCSPTSLTYFNLGYDLLSISQIGFHILNTEWNQLEPCYLAMKSIIQLHGLCKNICDVFLIDVMLLKQQSVYKWARSSPTIDELFAAVNGDFSCYNVPCCDTSAG